MKKLDILPHDAEGECMTPSNFDKFLHSTVQPEHFAALRDIFLLANELSDCELMQIAGRADEVCV